MMNKQKGATLIVALVLLVIVSLFGIAGMRGTTLEMKMIASARDRAMAFEAAESTLRLVEGQLLEAETNMEAIKAYKPDCAGAAEGAPENSGRKGYCFSGEFDIDEPYTTCTILPSDITEFSPVWDSENNWSGENGNFETQEVSVAEGDAETAETINTKYFVEFMCFTLRDAGAQATLDDRENGDGSLIYMPLYRVTALAEGLGQRARVMSQSMVKVEVQ